MQPWLAIHMASMIVITIWSIAWGTLPLTYISGKASRARKVAWPIFRYGRYGALVAINAAAVSSAMLGHTWEWIAPGVTFLGVYISYLFPPARKASDVRPA